jgi:hypothetical protein
MIYTDEEELLFKKAGEQAECMAILHNLSNILYSKASVWTNVPVIVLSSVIGFLSTVDLFNNQNLMLGVLSILVSLIKSLDNYFDYTKRAEAHRITSLNYMKIARLIEIQLTLKREDRVSAEDLLSIILNDIASLRESEPQINNSIIKKFNDRYSQDLTCKPSIVNGLTDIKIYKATCKDATLQVVIPNEEENASVSPTVATTSRPQRSEWRR